MKKLLRFIFSIYAAFAFMLWIIIAFTVYLFTNFIYGRKKDREFLVFLYRFIGKAICYSIFLKVDTYFHTQYDKKESYVVVSNHQTMIDIPANVIGAPDAILFKFLGKQEADRLPFFGYLINRLCILVDRKSDASRKSSFQRMRVEMDKGYSIFIYPEGTRNRTIEPLKEFYDGAFRLAIEMQKPLVVNTLVGIKELNPPTSFFTYMPGTFQSHWEVPISTKGMCLDDLPKLKEQVQVYMKNRLLQN